ncbi:MAG: hypothetical protein ACK4VN_15065 [Bacteroidales bacterium]
MKLSTNIRQQMSLQLQVSLALDQGIEEVHHICEEHAHNDSSKLLKAIRRLYFKNNRLSLFRGVGAQELLRAHEPLFMRVLDLAITRHKGEFRNSGHPYIAHALSTGFVLSRLGFPPEVIFSGILHDTLEDSNHVTDTLNVLYGLNPAIAWYVLSVSGINTQDAVEKDKQLKVKVESFSELAGNLFPQVIKCADGIANLYDVEGMEGRDGRTATQRQRRFLEESQQKLLPWARQIDEAMLIKVKAKREENFKLSDYISDCIDNKISMIDPV